MFSSSDPLEQDWNVYGYCGANPVNFIDPDGMFVGEVLAGGQIITNSLVITEEAVVIGEAAQQAITAAQIFSALASIGSTAFNIASTINSNLNGAANFALTNTIGRIPESVWEGIDQFGNATMALEGAGAIPKEIAVAGREIRALGEAADVAKSVRKGVSVIGPRSTYREFARQIGAHYLDVTDEAWTWAKNEDYLRGIVSRGDEVVFSGKFNPNMLDPQSALAKEISYLAENGYKWTADFSKMVK